MKKASSEKYQALLLGSTVLLGLLIGRYSGLRNLHSVVDFFAEFLLPLFFVSVGIELRHEFTSGFFVTRKKIIAPALAAIAGVILPAGLYLWVAGNQNGGWAVPTSTDITFGLALISLLGPKIRAALKPRFLAYATIDDVIGIGILLVVFSSHINLIYLAVSGMCLVGLIALNRLVKLWYLEVALGILCIVMAVEGGIQSSLVAVLIGMGIKQTANYRNLPRINGWFVLPIFSLLVSINAGAELASGLATVVLMAVLTRPLGKWVGISIVGALAERISTGVANVKVWSLLGILGGLGFTVSLLVAQLAHEDQPATLNSAVLGTLSVTVFSAALFVVATRITDRRERLAERSL